MSQHSRKILNLENKQSYLYITALDKPQIAGVEKINLKRFKDFTNEITERFCQKD